MRPEKETTSPGYPQTLSPISWLKPVTFSPQALVNRQHAHSESYCLPVFPGCRNHQAITEQLEGLSCELNYLRLDDLGVFFKTNFFWVQCILGVVEYNI